MEGKRPVLSQLLDFVPRYEFRDCVARYRGDGRVRSLSCWNQYLAMSFAQLTGRDSLRDLQNCTRALSPQLYRCGLRARLSRSTLADANELRDWRIYRDFAHVLIAWARRLYVHEPMGVELEQAAYALDSTTIDLSLTLFPWALFRKHKAAVKLHTLLDLHGNIPSFVRVTHGKIADVTVLDHIIPQPGAFYVMDKGYTDFLRLHRFHQAAAFFILPAKRDLDFRRRSYREVDKSTGLRSDQTIALVGPKTAHRYPDPLRRIGFFDQEERRRLTFLTNNFLLPALAISQLYKRRWQIELFFKWIKQNLRIKSFLGTSPNAVKTQVWIAISVYVLVAIIKKQLRIPLEMSEMLQILSISLLEEIALNQLLTPNISQELQNGACKQLNLFD